MHKFPLITAFLYLQLHGGKQQLPKVPAASVGDETVLKINEDDLCDVVLAAAAAVADKPMQHTKKDSMSTDWTSEESMMLRGVDTVDEDNK